MQKAVFIIVHGTVQGVGFRSFARHHAIQLGIQGWVQNREEGHVEIHAEGEQDILKQYIEAIQKGPGWVSVVHAETTPAKVQGFKEFEIRD
jgi:acylphosphatase